ncbi:MAG: LptA/OstA family protein [Alphaproteobacteria bacterium]
MIAAALAALAVGFQPRDLPLAVGPAAAQSLGSVDIGSSDAPLEVTAEDGIEWRRDEKVYVARGNARAARGDLSVTADVLTARYREDADGKIEVYSIEAEGNVRLASADSVVSGDRAVYDIDKAVLLVTGGNLRAETPKAVVTARDSLEYWDQRRVIVARGDAVAVEGDRRVEADRLTGYLRGADAAESGIYQVEAEGNVRLTTPAEIVRAAKAVYNLDKEIATLTGGVKITRGQNQLNGDSAEVNLKTGVSRLMGNPSATGAGDGRVHTLIIPDRKPELGTQ